MQLACIVNGASRHKVGCADAVQQLVDSEFEVDVHYTAHAGHALELARDAAASRDCIVAVGGDGTLHEVVNGCLQAEVATGQEPTIALLPFGTANDFLKSTALVGSGEELLSLLRAGDPASVDVGRMNFRNHEGLEEERYFINIADVGIGGEVARRVNRGARLMGPNITFLRAILLSLLRFEKPQLSISVDGQPLDQGEFLAVVAANGCCFGAGLQVAPGALLDDGKLAVTLVGDVGVREFISQRHKLRKGRRIDHPEVQYCDAVELRVESLVGACPVEADGEFIGYTPLTVELLPGRIRFLM